MLDQRVPSTLLFWHMCSSSLTNRCRTSLSAGTIIQLPSNTWSSSGNHMGLMMVCSNRNHSPLTHTQSCQDFKQLSPQRFCKVHSFTVVLKSEFLFVQAGACVYTTGLAWNSSPPALWISCVNNAVVTFSFTLAESRDFGVVTEIQIFRLEPTHVHNVLASCVMSGI